MNSPYGGDKTFFSIKKREIICKLGISILIHDIIVIKTAIKSTHTKKWNQLYLSPFIFPSLETNWKPSHFVIQFIFSFCIHDLSSLV